MERDLLETIFLTAGVVICVCMLGAFLLLSYLANHLGQRYVRITPKNEQVDRGKTSLRQKVSDWYLTRKALPFWYILGLDCLILVYSQIMASYLVLGGQVLVPLFWDYFLLAVGSLPFYYIGMKLFRSYETIVRFSRMEDLARIMCALFVGTILVDVVKHFVPESILPIYPLWQEQLVMLICAVILMWSVRILVKSLYDNSSFSKSKIRSYIYGTSSDSIQVGLDVRREEEGNCIVLAFVRAHDKEPHTTIKGAEILDPQDDIIESMIVNHAESLFVPFSAYPEFVDAHKDLVKKLMAKKIMVVLR